MAPAAGGKQSQDDTAAALAGLAGMPKLKVRYQLAAKLVPYARNARTHSAAQVSQIAGSIREFGFTNPVLLDGAGGILAGHGRVLAAEMLGLKRVPTIDLAHLSEAQRRAYVIADNQLALNAGWNRELLAVDMGELKAEGFDVGLVGFKASELEDILLRGGRTGGLTDEDATPDEKPAAVSRREDVWICGRHRIACGDATVPRDVERVLAGAVPLLMVTDPPYGVNYDADWRNRVVKKTGKAVGARAIGKVTNDDRADWRDAWALFPGNVAYIWHYAVKGHLVADSLVAVNFELRAQIVWVKQRHVISRGHYHSQHESAVYAVREGQDDNWRFTEEHMAALYAVRKGNTGNWHGDRKQSTVWNIDHVKSETGHSTQKPVECMRRPIENNSAAGEAIYDPFLGSGTTVIAAETTGRGCLGLEIEPGYVDMAVTRWQAFTGETATLEGSGKTFDEVARSPAREGEKHERSKAEQS
jgi:DNA modification methylase